MMVEELRVTHGGSARVAAERVRGALLSGRLVYARLDGPNHGPDHKDGDIVPVRFATNRELYEPLHPDGSAANPGVCPGYVLGDTGWQVGWEGGGFYNPHTILLPEPGEKLQAEAGR